MISPSPRTVKQELAGQSFQITDVTGKSIDFNFPSSFGAWPRRGMEGIVIPVTCSHPVHGPIPSIMKCFDHHLQQRSSRQEYLVRLGLAGMHDWLYEGVPYLWMNREVCGVPVYGHVAKHVGNALQGDDFRIIRDREDYDDYTEDNRLEMAAQLCVAVAGLERIGIVHGDLSPANIVVGRDAHGARCSIIDYDGFYSDSVPMLPRMYEDIAVRPLGSPGYQHPSLMRRMALDKDNTDQGLRVENDRFSLAVLCFELITWNSGVFESLETMELLDLEQLAMNKLAMPDEIARRWPEGFELLKQCAEEQDPAALPSPEDWLATLGFPVEGGSASSTAWISLPRMKISRRVGNQPEKPVTDVLFQNEGTSSGNLELVNAELKDIVYSYTINDEKCESLQLSINWKHPVFDKSQGRSVRIANTETSAIDILPGMTIMTNGWSLAFSESNESGT